MEFNRTIIAATACGFVILLGLGCNSSNTLTGTLLAGAPVEGVPYVSESTSGITTAQGEFEYKDGELIRFYVGDILLGSATGAARMSPFNLAGIEPPVASKDIQAATQIRSLKPAGTPFENAVNLTVFLLTLDDDGDPANGIRIPEWAAELGVGHALTFNTSWETFQRRFAFSPFLKSVRQSGAWTKSPSIVGPSLALDIVYAGLSLQPELLVADEQEQDTNGDGVVDRRSRTKVSADGLQTIFERDTNLDGVYEPIGITNYDRNGHWTGNTSVSPDGMALPPDDVNHYDGNGYMFEVRQGNPAIWRVQITNDPGGLHSLEQIDTNNDGVFDSNVAISYDSVGRLVQTETDTDMDGVANQRTSYQYDEFGREHVRESGSSLQKTNPIRYRETTSYSDDGLEVTSESINLNNPSPPSRGGKRRDATGNRLESYWIDPTKGAEQLTEKNTYGDNGQLLSKAFYSNGTVTWHTTVLSYKRVSHWAALYIFSEFSQSAPPGPPPTPALSGGGMGGGMGGGGGGGGM